MDKEMNYHDELNKKNILKLRELLSTLPPFCRQFFRGIEDTSATRTRIAYAYDIRIFFEFIHETNGVYKKMDIVDYPLSILDEIKREDIEEYMEYLSYYKKDGVEYMNDERGKKRKLASLRSFYNYYFRNEMISSNPASLVPLPKLHEKEIIRMEPNEVAVLLDEVEEGSGLTKKEMSYHKKTGTRDLAILTLLLGTGIRVSECVGLDLNDVDFDNQRLKVRRKGGYEDLVYFGEEVADALQDYLKEERKYLMPQEKFGEVIRFLAKEHGFEVFDLYNSNILDGHDKDNVLHLMPDGVHPNAEGYRILGEHIAAELIRLLEERLENSLDSAFSNQDL